MDIFLIIEMIFVGIPFAILIMGFSYFLLSLPFFLILFFVRLMLNRFTLDALYKRIIFVLFVVVLCPPIVVNVVYFGIAIPNGWYLIDCIYVGDFSPYEKIYYHFYNHKQMLVMSVIANVGFLIFVTRYTSRLFKDPAHDIEKSA